MKTLIRRTGLACTALLALALMPTIGAAQELSDIQSNGNLHLRGYGNGFIEGETHSINADTARGGQAGNTFAGLSMINQMYFQFMLPQAQNGKKHYPIGIVHGCCLSTKSWQTTPDGRMGWDEYFVRQGFDTYMIDQVGRARSGFDATKYNMVRTDNLPCTPWTAPSGNYHCLPGTTPHPDRHRPVRLECVPLGNHALHGFAMFHHHHTSSGS